MTDLLVFLVIAGLGSIHAAEGSAWLALLAGVSAGLWLATGIDSASEALLNRGRRP